MSGWITDRPPTADDTDESGSVIVTTKDRSAVVFWHYRYINAGEPWMPVPKPYQPPKPKRREWTNVTDIAGFCGDGWKHTLDERITVREVLDGDMHPDEAIELRQRREDAIATLEEWRDGLEVARVTWEEIGEVIDKLRGES